MRSGSATRCLSVIRSIFLGPGGSGCGQPTRSGSRCRRRWPGVGRNAFAHESGIHADGALKDRGNYELYDDATLGPFPSDWFAREGRVVLTGEYGGKAGFRHVLEALRITVASGDEDLVFSLVQLCAAATGKPLTDDELRLIAGYPHQLALLYPGLLS